LTIRLGTPATLLDIDSAGHLIVYPAWYAERSGDNRWKQSLATAAARHLIAYQ
jgi:hypothetical protein